MARTFQLVGASTTIDLIDADATGITAEYEQYSKPDLPVGEGKIIERWTFALKASSQDNAASQIQALEKIRYEARQFHQAVWRTKPVYLKQQAKNETNARYAMVYDIPSISAPDPFTVPLESGAGAASSFLSGLEMAVIRAHPWESGTSGTLGSALTLSPSNGTGSPTLVQVANFRDDEAIDTIKVDDGGVFGSNFASTAAFSLFPTVPVANDALYVGAPGPWKHVVFRIGTAANWNVGIAVEYWNGASWATAIQGQHWSSFNKDAGSHISNDLFSEIGEWSINVIPPVDWAATTVDGGSKRWFRFRISSVTSSTTVPANATYAPYTQRNPYVAIPASSIKGDSPPVFNMRMWSPAGGTSSPGVATISRVLIGAKSRNLSSFTSHLNAGGQDNPGAWTTAYGTDGASATGTSAPGGAHCAVSFSTDSSMTSRVQFTGSQLLDDYVGEYLVFVRCQQIGGDPGDISLMVRTYLGGNSFVDTSLDSREEKTRGADQGNEVLDFGLLMIPFVRAFNADDMGTVSILFQIHAERHTGTSILRIYDLILMPVDEGVVAVDDPVSDSSTGRSALRGGTALDLDAGVIADRTIKYRFISDHLIPMETWGRQNRPVPFENLNTATRLYFLMLHYPANGTWGEAPLVSSLGCHLAVELYGRYRYSILRGND